ncbi:MAG: hypothetical protein AB8G05_15475 [Oligoflexales bacterium]
MTILRKSHALIGMALLNIFLHHPVYGEEQFKDPIISLSLSIIGKQRLIKESLNGAKNALEKFINDAVLPAQKVSPPEQKCNEGNIGKYGIMDAWKVCPGIPDYFFSDGNRVPNLRPRPVYLQLGKTVFRNVVFDDIRVPCEGTSCDIIIPLKSLEIHSELDVKVLNKSKKLKAHETIIKLNPITLKLDNALGNRKPFIKLRGTLQANKNSQSIFKFDEKKSLMYFPHGLVKMDLAPHLNRRNIGQIMNTSGKLSVNKYVFSTLLGVSGVLNEDLSELYKLIDLDKLINDHFNDPGKIGHVNNLVNSKLLPTLLRLINEGIKNADIFGGSQYTIPGHRLQDLLDQSKLFQLIGSLHDYIISLHDFSDGSNDELTEYSYNGLLLNQAISGLEHSRNTQLIDKLKEVLKLTKSLKNKTKYPHIEAQLSGQVMAIEDTCKRLIVQIKKNEAMYQQDIQLVLDLENHNDGGMKLRLSEVLENASQQNVVNRSDWDLAGFVGFNTLNRILENSHHEKRLDFCLNNNPSLVCSQDNSQNQNVLHVMSEQAPQIIWDPENSLHYLSLQLRVGESRVGYRIYLKPSIDDKLRIIFFNRIEIDNPPEDEQLEQIIINHMLAFIRSIHPLLENLVPKTLKVGELSEQEGAYPLEFSWLDFHEIAVLPGGFLTSGKVKEEADQIAL